MRHLVFLGGVSITLAGAALTLLEPAAGVVALLLGVALTLGGAARVCAVEHRRLSAAFARATAAGAR